MEVLKENRFEEFKSIYKSDYNKGILVLKLNAFEPHRKIKCQTDKWIAIIDEKYKLNKANKIYLKRIKEIELIISKDKIYQKINSRLKIINPFNYSDIIHQLITKEEIFRFYNIDFLLQYKGMFEYVVKMSTIKKNNITNPEKLFKITYPYVPYKLGIKIYEYLKNKPILLNNNTFGLDMRTRSTGQLNLYTLNEICKNISNPNLFLSFDIEKSIKLFRNNIFNDTITMFSYFDKKVNLLWSEKRLKEEHDKISKKIIEIKSEFVENKILKINNVFKNILPIEFEILDTTRKLYIEGKTNNHCVYSSNIYVNRINKGESCIYSTLYDNEKYTLELNYYNNKIELNQFRGYLNKNAPLKLFEIVKNHIFIFNKNLKTNSSEYSENILKENNIDFNYENVDELLVDIY